VAQVIVGVAWFTVIVVLAVAAVILTTGGSRPAAPTAGHRTAHLVPLAVFSQPQTAIDRSLPGVLRTAARLGGLPPTSAADALRGTIPSSTHYVETLPGDREVFISSVRDAAPPRPGHSSPSAVAEAGVRLIIVQPDGKWTHGPPIVAPTLGSADNRSAYMEAVGGGGAGCFLDTYIGVAPNNVSRVRWEFPRQDRQGYVYKAPLTVDIPVRDNVVATTIPQRATCDGPSVVALYGPRGGLLIQTGRTANLDRITRPIRHGNPFAGRDRLERRPRPR